MKTVLRRRPVSRDIVHQYRNDEKEDASTDFDGKKNSHTPVVKTAVKTGTGK